MRDPESELFSNKTVVRHGAYVNIGQNVLYTTVSLVGMLTQRRRPVESLLDLGSAMDSAYAAVQRRGVPGELANMVWACSLASDSRGGELLKSLVTTEPRVIPSGELGQVLYGLVVGADAFTDDRDAAMAVAGDCAEELSQRFDARAGVFRATARRFPPRRAVLESRLTHFAAQVYPLHGLTAHCLHTGKSPPEAIRGVADRIVEAQGSQGQWWWLYSSRRRTVIEGYPVYSVHQDGMAILGLAKLRELGIGDYGEPLARGLEWINGANELGVKIAGGDPPLINRCIQRVGSHADRAYGISRSNLVRAFARSALPMVGGDRIQVDPARLEVLCECRSYHLGWLLYADSLVNGRAGAGSAS